MPGPKVPPIQDPDEPVWTYRGYRLKTSEFVTAMVHFFRAEVQRAEHPPVVRALRRQESDAAASS